MRSRDRGWWGIVVAIVLVAAPAMAQPIVQSDETLRADGWMFDDEGATPGNVPGGMLSILFGSAFHGVGHLVAGDRQTATLLFATEGIAIAMIAAGLVTRTVGDTSPTARAAGTTLEVSGGALFAAGWIADIVGTFKGTALALPPNGAELEGVTVEGYISTLLGDPLGVNAITSLRVPVIQRRWVLIPEAHVGVDANYRRFGGFVGWRAPFGTLADNVVQLGAAGYDERIRDDDYGRTHLAASAALHLNIGTLIPHLDGLVWRHRIDLAVEHISLDSASTGPFSRDNRLIHVPVETSLGFNLNQGVYLEMGYQHRRDALVGMIGDRAEVGAFVGRLGFSPRNRLGIDLRVEHGEYTRLWFGLQWLLVRPAAAAN